MTLSSPYNMCATRIKRNELTRQVPPQHIYISSAVAAALACSRLASRAEASLVWLSPITCTWPHNRDCRHVASRNARADSAVGCRVRAHSRALRVVSRRGMISERSSRPAKGKARDAPRRCSAHGAERRLGASAAAPPATTRPRDNVALDPVLVLPGLGNVPDPLDGLVVGFLEDLEEAHV